MSEPRVSDSRLAQMRAWMESGNMLEGLPGVLDDTIDDLALDLRDCRAALAQVTLERDDAKLLTNAKGYGELIEARRERDALRAERDRLREALDDFLTWHTEGVLVRHLGEPRPDDPDAHMVARARAALSRRTEI